MTYGIDDNKNLISFGRYKGTYSARYGETLSIENVFTDISDWIYISLYNSFPINVNSITNLRVLLEISNLNSEDFLIQKVDFSNLYYIDYSVIRDTLQPKILNYSYKPNTGGNIPLYTHAILSRFSNSGDCKWYFYGNTSWTVTRIS